MVMLIELFIWASEPSTERTYLAAEEEQFYMPALE
jgi:hypothetical protein